MLPVTTCSPQSFALAKASGAVEVFDYHSPACGAEIRKYTNDTLEYVLDCISTIESLRACYAAVGSKGGKYMALEAPSAQAQFIRQDITPDWIIMFTMFNQPIKWQKPFYREAQPEDGRFAKRWFEVAQVLLDHGAIAPQCYEARSGGLAGVIEGVDSVRKGKVAGLKLVYQCC